jgi:hypothetical protein
MDVGDPSKTGDVATAFVSRPHSQYAMSPVTSFQIKTDWRLYGGADEPHMDEIVLAIILRYAYLGAIMFIDFTQAKKKKKSVLWATPS